eukprot:10586040-Prorocentrum_lima.AAC.1
MPFAPFCSAHRRSSRRIKSWRSATRFRHLLISGIRFDAQRSSVERCVISLSASSSRNGFNARKSEADSEDSRLA